MDGWLRNLIRWPAHDNIILSVGYRLQSCRAGFENVPFKPSSGLPDHLG